MYPDCLELIYTTPQRVEGKYTKSSYVLYNKKLAEIERIYRLNPNEQSPRYKDWKQEIQSIECPSIFGRLNRSIRNAYSVLRDAFSQALGMIVGIAMQKSKRMQSLSTSDKRAKEVGQTLLEILPNAYEPVLEKYIGSTVVVESLLDGKIDETVGILQDYSLHYLIVRAAHVDEALPNETKRKNPI